MAETISLESLVPDSVLDQPNAELLSWIKNQQYEAQERLCRDVFSQFLSRASRPKHISGDAGLRLCWFVQECRKATLEPLRRWAFSQHTYSSLLNFYVEWNENDPHRSIRLVLDLLVILISANPDPVLAATLRQSALKNLIAIICRNSAQPVAKSAMKVLDHMVSKAMFSLADLESCYRDANPLLSSAESPVLWKAMIVDLVQRMQFHYLCPVAGKLVVTITRSLAALGDDQAFAISAWQQWLEECLLSDPTLLDGIKTYIFTPLFKTDRPLSLSFLQNMNRLKPAAGLNSEDLDTAALLQLAAFEAGKRVSLVEEPLATSDGQASCEPTKQVIFLREEVLSSVLRHHAPGIRSMAFSILICSPSTTRPYSGVAFKLLRQHLPGFHVDPDARFRYELLGHSKDMVRRIKGAIDTLSKTIKRLERAYEKLAKDPSTLDSLTQQKKVEIDRLYDSLREHIIFYEWYLGFLAEELVPTASYQRHFTALRAMNFVFWYEGEMLTSTSWSNTVMLGALGLFDPNWARLLLDRIMDPFDDVREAAASTLMLLPTYIVVQPLSGNLPLRTIGERFYAKADEISRQTGRADHADGVAKGAELLCCWSETHDAQLVLLSDMIARLESRLALAQSDLGTAVLDSPVHGIFAALSGMWKLLSTSTFTTQELESLSQIQAQIVCLGKLAWNIVKDVLCDDSPEGHLPQDLEDVEGLDTKDLLSYSFRAVHESSSLLKTIVGNVKSGRPPGSLFPSRAAFEDIGHLTFEQLSTLRHRGAFTTVTHTFSACCQAVKHLPQVVGDGKDVETTVLDTWYEGALSCIFEQASTTRRSAGIPALMTGILSANTSRPSFDTVMRRLEGIGGSPVAFGSTDGTKFPQVHALNCLKDVFKSSFLSKRAEPYLPNCFHLASRSLKSDVWAIRNCGLILLRSLIDCLFGTSDSKTMMDSGWDGKTNRISYTKYSTLPEVLKELLEPQNDEPTALAPTSAEMVFPALDIIRRAGPPEATRDELYTHISEYLGSPIWHVRELAARTLCSFFLHELWMPMFVKLSGDTRGSSNRAHGILLTAKFVVEKLPNALPGNRDEELSVFLAKLQQNTIQEASKCPEVRAAFVEVLNIITDTSTSKSTAIRSPIDREPASMCALLQSRLALKALYKARTLGDTSTIAPIVRKTLNGDTDISLVILESIPNIWRHQNDDSPEDPSTLVSIYMEATAISSNPEIRATALVQLAETLDGILRSKTISAVLSSEEQLLELWGHIGTACITPSLANAAVRVSGAVLASIILHQNQNESSVALSPMLQQALPHWGIMMRASGHDNKTFDARLSSIQSLHSFFLPLPTGALLKLSLDGASFLPPLLAIYDALNDDDEEIRGIAAQTTAVVMDAPHTTPIEAAEGFLGWLSQTFAASTEFKAHVVGRIVGDSSIIPTPTATITTTTSTAATSPAHDDPRPVTMGDDRWIPASSQLSTALPTNLSLFKVEEQNLFIDEVREAKRWTKVFTTIHDATTSSQDATGAEVEALQGWLSGGLDALTKLAEEKGDEGQDDGGAALGWESQPDVFAICARIVLGAGVLVKTGSCGELGVRLEGLKKVLERKGGYGGLAVMVDVGA